MKERMTSPLTYPGYPTKRLVIETIDENTNLTLPDGEWSTGVYIFPSEEKQQELRNQGYELDDFGRPLHPWLREMLCDPEVGVVTGLGNYWNWGPNYAADPVVINTDEVPKILLIQRGDTGSWALPGGFVDSNEQASEAARRELHEEAGLMVCGEPYEIYRGIVADSRATAHAWCETTAVLWRVDGTPQIYAGDDAQKAKWFPINELPNVLHGSHAIIVEQALSKLDEAEVAHTINIPARIESYRKAKGGHMQYRRLIANTSDGSQLFIKSHDKHAFTNETREAHSREYLYKEKMMYDHVTQHGFAHVPNSVELIDDHSLVMEAYPEEDGWRWRAPAEDIDRYVHDVFTAIDGLESIPLLNDYYDSEEPIDELLYHLGWARYDRINSYFHIQKKFAEWLPQFRENFRGVATDLAQSSDILQILTPPMDKGVVFAHHDLRQANIAWHPKHGARIVDWSWAGAGPKNADATMLLIDLHKSGHDVSKYMDRFNRHHAKILIGYWLRQCQLEPATPGSNVRFQQALSAVCAYDLLMKNRER